MWALPSPSLWGLPSPSPDDSDVDLLTVSGGDPSNNSVNRTVSSYQPIVHFEGSVREPIGPRDLDYTSRENVKKSVTHCVCVCVCVHVYSNKSKK